MARPDPAFREAVERFEGTVRARGVAYSNGLALRLAANRGDAALSSLARTLERSPLRMAALVTNIDRTDPYLLAALAGRRSMQDLAGVRPVEGRSEAPPTMLEMVAQEAAQRHWNRCRTQPAEAKRREAAWAGQRQALRAGQLGPALSALDTTYGAACAVERQAALGQSPTVAPAADYLPLGPHRLPGLPSRRWERLAGQAAVRADPPQAWGRPRPTPRNQRARLAYIARGVGRGQQLAGRRFAPRIAVTRVVDRFWLRRALKKGLVATRRYLLGVASNPRRMAAAIRDRMDPMLVAAALGPKAIDSLLSGRKTEFPGPLGRFHDALQTAETDRLSAVRHDPRSGRPEGVTSQMEQRALEGGLQGDTEIQDLTRGVVERVYTGTSKSVDPTDVGPGVDPDTVYDTWRRRRALVVSGLAGTEISDQLSSPTRRLADRRVDQPRPGPDDADWRSAPTGYRPGSDRYGPGPGDPSAERGSGSPIPRSADSSPAESRFRSGPDPKPIVPPIPGDGPPVDTGPEPGSREPRGSASTPPVSSPDGAELTPTSDPPVGEPQPVEDQPRPSAGGPEVGSPADSPEPAPADSVGHDLESPSPGRPASIPTNLDFEPPPEGAPVLSFHPTFTVDPPENPDLVDRSVKSRFPDPVIPSGQEGRFTLESDGSWKAHGDPEVDRVVPRPDGSYDVQGHNGLPVVPANVDGSFAWAVAQVEKRVREPFDHELARRQADAFDAAHPDYPAPTSNREQRQERPSLSDGRHPLEEDPVARAARVAKAAAQSRASGGSGPEGRAAGPPPKPAPVSERQATIRVPAGAIGDVDVKDQDLPRLEALDDGSWKVVDDPYVDRVIPRSDGSFDVVLHEGVRPGLADPDPDRADSPQVLVVDPAEREKLAQELDRASVDSLAEAVEAGHSPLDVPRSSPLSSTLAYNPASDSRYDGLDGEMLRSQAHALGTGGDARFATREEIEAAGGKVRVDAHGVVVMRGMDVAAQPLTSPGKPKPEAEAVTYQVSVPDVLYHVDAQTHPKPDFGSRVPPAPAPRAQDLVAKDLADSVGVPPPKGVPRLEATSGSIDLTVQSAVKPDSSGGRKAGPPAAPAGTYADDPADRALEEKLVQRLAAGRVASRIGSAYSPPSFSADPAKERVPMAKALRDPERLQRLSREADRVASWVVDGAKDRLHERGRSTAHERVTGQGPQPTGSDQSKQRSRETSGDRGGR